MVYSSLGRVPWQGEDETFLQAGKTPDPLISSVSFFILQPGFFICWHRNMHDRDTSFWQERSGYPETPQK